MVRVDGKISSDALLHFFMFVSQHVTEITSPVETVVGLNKLRVFVFVAVDHGANVGQFGQ